MSIKTAYLKGPFNIEYQEHELPRSIHPDALLLEVIQSNVCGSDVHIYSGNHPARKSGSLGHEMVGRIIMKGENVTTDFAGNPVQLGDRVVPVYYLTCHKCKRCLKGDYFLCENKTSYKGKITELPWFEGSTFSTHYYVHPQQYFFKVPDNVSSIAASSSNCALSQVIFGINHLEVKKDDFVLIQGAGALGINACAVVRERGAKPIVLDTVPERLEQAKRFGASHIINISDLQEKEIKKKLNSITNNNGINYCIEVTGAANAFASGIKLLNRNGTYLVLGTLSDIKVAISPGEIIRKSLNIIAFNHYDPRCLYQALNFIKRNNNYYNFEELISDFFDFPNLEEAIDKSYKKEVTRAAIVFNQK